MMNEQSRRERPFRTLGWHLRFAREQLKESAMEVSGAVEIDTEVLEQIEYGEKRPSEEVLQLLINHLGFREEEATSLWELAGYTDSQNDDVNRPDGSEFVRQLAVVMPLDMRIIYTDKVYTSVNDNGVVLNFMQGAGPNDQPLPVARVGMSREHAKSVLEVLRQTLAQADMATRPKFLPSPNQSSDKTDIK